MTFYLAGIEKDKIKEEYLNSIGIKVLRFENYLVFKEIEFVLGKIRAEFNHP